jgi:hypothetical protein
MNSPLKWRLSAIKQTIRFSHDGSKYYSVYNDSLASLDLGDFQVERVSDVDYDHERKLWVARLKKNGQILCESSSRNECVKLEVDILNQQLKTSKL